MLQVVASLLEEARGVNVYARRYCPGGYTWQQHLGDAKDPKRSLYRLLGEGGQKHWDYIVFQVSEQPATHLQDLQCAQVHWACYSGNMSVQEP